MTILNPSTPYSKKQSLIESKFFTLAITFGIGILLWFAPSPDGLSKDCWHLFSVFCAIITGLILKPLPVAPLCMIGVLTAILTHLISFEEAFEPLAGESIWLIVFASFMARGLIKTGLATRVSYFVIRLFGKTTLGLSYSLLCGDLLIAPFTPSIVARGGGVIYPIILGILKKSKDDGSSYSADEMGRFLILSVFQGSLTTSAMFMTAMAANPICQQIALSVGIPITWGTWAIAGIVPGLLSLGIVPLIVYLLSPPKIKKSPEAPLLAKKKLKDLGPVTKKEYTMLFSFVLVLFLWLFGHNWGIESVVAPMCGLAILFLMNILSWKDCLDENSAWNTLFWLGVLIGLGLRLKDLGLFSWLSEQIVFFTANTPMAWGFVLIVLTYFYSHYFLASNTVHVTAMYSAFLLASISIGIPGLYAALMLAFMSNLIGGITHFANTTAPIYYASQQVSLGRWWSIGLIVSIVNLLIWGGIGSVWCYILGML